MKLFLFYPKPYTRMYVLGECANEVAGRHEEIFEYFINEDYPWLNMSDPDDKEFIEEMRAEFLRGLIDLQEIPSGIAIDSHF